MARYGGPNPPRRPLFWTDGIEASPVEDVDFWLQHGYPIGWVVCANDLEHALQIGRYRMGIFDKIGEAPVFEFGVYMPPDFDGEVQIESAIVKPTFNKGDMFICEFSLMTSNLADHPPGSKRSWLVKLIDPTTAMPNIKQLIFGIFAIELNTPAETSVNQRLSAFMPRVIGPENILAGMKAHLTTRATTTKKQTLFTRHQWTPPSTPNPSFDAVFASPPRYVAPPPAPPAYAAPPVYAAQPPAYAPPPVYAAPPPAAPPPPPAAPPVYTPDGRYQLDPRTNSWIPRT